MKSRLTNYTMILALVGAAVALGSPGVSRASSIVLPGFDLFESLEGTTFQGQPFTGVPLGSFSFPGIGVRGTGNTDTIVQREASASAPTTTLPIEMLALQLMSVDAIGPGGSHLFITLQSARGGPATTGQMVINFDPEPPSLEDPHGTFDSFFDVFFDLRIDSVNGTIIASDSGKLFTGLDDLPGVNDPADDVGWRHRDPTALVIPGVNFRLNGIDESSDFHPIGVFSERKDDPPAEHVVRTTQVPAPSAFVLLGIGILGATGWQWARRKTVL